MNKSLTFQHLHLEGNAGWVRHTHMFSLCSQGAHWVCWSNEEFIDSLGLGLGPRLTGGTETELPVSGEFGNAAQ